MSSTDTSTATPTVPSARLRGLSRIGWLAAWILLSIYFVIPPREAMDHTLDSSNYGTYALFVAEGRQYGPEVIPMAGPLGFVLYGHTYAGVMFQERWVLELSLKAAFAALLLHLIAVTRPRSLAALWAVAAVILIPTIDDILHDYAILLAGLCMVRAHHDGSRRWALFAALLLGPISLMKGTHFVTTSFITGIAVAYGLWRRQPVVALQQAGCFVGSLLISWLGTGQNPANLPLYVRNVLELSSGYNAAMGLDEPTILFATGLSLAVALVALMVWGWWVAGRRLGVSTALVLVAAFSFIKWKHGFLRADGHVYIFFTAAALLAPTILATTVGGLFAPRPRLTPPWRRAGVGLFTFLLAWGYISSCTFWDARMIAAVTDVAKFLPRNAAYVFHPARVRAQFERELDAHRLDRDLPQIRNEVGDDPIDFFGYEQGVLLLNDLIYEPRPFGGGTFNVFTPRLQQLNEAYVRDRVHHPKWQLLKIGLLDHRLPSADDGLALRALLEEYTPVMMQRDYLLLKERAHPLPPAEPQLLGRNAITFGESIPVPSVAPDEMVLFAFEGELSLHGKLQSFFYRPPDLIMEAGYGGDSRFRKRFDFKPGTTRLPVILSPFAESTDGIIDLYESGRGTPVDSIAFSAEPGYDETSLFISFYKVPRPPAPEDSDITEIRTYHKFPLFNRTPVNYVSEETGIRELNKEAIRIVHAPGSITWNLKPDDQQLIFSYGMMPQAYTDGGTTDGVTFHVEVLWPPHDGREIWNRFLTPLYHSTDQGMQRSRIMLPPFEPGAQLRIRTDAGPAGNGAYDQSYITRVQIKQGPLVPAQFNGLGVIPSDRTLPRDAISNNGEQAVFLLHAPHSVRIDRPVGTTSLTIGYGLLPTAYENGGQSDGVGFRLVLETPEAPERELARWFLNPRDNPAERGKQTRTITLPEFSPGQTLRIETDVGPAGNRGWDQSYLTDLSFNGPAAP